MSKTVHQIAILAFLWGSPLAAIAQLNDSTHYRVGITSTGTLNNTNTSHSFITNQTGKMNVKYKDISLNANVIWTYGLLNKRLTNNDFNSTLDCNIYKTLPHFYYWGLATYTSSYSLKINEQFQTGIGVAYNILDSTNVHLNISDGLLYEKSDIRLPKDSTNDVYTTFRNSLRITFRWVIKDMVTINGTSYYQNSLSSVNDYIIRSNLGLSVKLYRWLSFTSAFTYNRFNRTGKENTLFTYGLSVEQYF